jgi:hypothetical protein
MLNIIVQLNETSFSICLLDKFVLSFKINNFKCLQNNIEPKVNDDIASSLNIAAGISPNNLLEKVVINIKNKDIPKIV